MEKLDHSNLILGCIADDFTGGSDAASFLAAGGMNTILLCEIPEPGFKLPPDVEAAVITLKSRTQETSAAVADSIAAIRWLKDAGAEHFYIKYCSTFDSTPDGNIGPIVDAALEELNTAGTILCPALPANQRIVKDGILYVKGVPLAESPMKDHPLTPMWESRISSLMKPQGKYASLEIHKDLLHSEKRQVDRMITDFTAGKEHWYLIPDYTDEQDAEKIAELFGDMKLLSGGSGILQELAVKLRKNSAPSTVYRGTEGPAIIVAGSCSTATHAQTLWYENHSGASLQLNDESIMNGTQTAVSIFEQMRSEEAPLIYSYDTPEGLQKKRNPEGRKLAAMIENTLAETAKTAMEHGVKRIIAAGGETSGAVTRALGYKAYYIGASVAPGVPVMTPVDDPSLRLVLKSGNFGQEDFFDRALALTAL